MTDVARRRLGLRAAQRRRALGLSAAEAARTAGLNPKTWEALEKGTRTTRDSNYAGIERALRWQHGSVEKILDGGKPEPLPEVEDEELQRLIELEQTVGTPIYEQVAGIPNAADTDRYTDPVTGEEYTDPDERELWGLTRLPAEERRKLIYYVRSERQRQQAEQRRKAG